MNKSKWEHCPRCGSNKVNQFGRFTAFFSLFGVGGTLLLFSLLFFPLVFIAVPMIILSPFALFMVKMNTCKDCNLTWQAGKANEYGGNK